MSELKEFEITYQVGVDNLVWMQSRAEDQTVGIGVPLDRFISELPYEIYGEILKAHGKPAERLESDRVDSVDVEALEIQAKDFHTGDAKRMAFHFRGRPYNTGDSREWTFWVRRKEYLKALIDLAQWEVNELEDAEKGQKPIVDHFIKGRGSDRHIEFKIREDPGTHLPDKPETILDERMRELLMPKALSDRIAEKVFKAGDLPARICVIVFVGNEPECELFFGSAVEAMEFATQDNRHLDYGRHGVLIFQSQLQFYKDVEYVRVITTDGEKS